MLLAAEILPRLIDTFFNSKCEDRQGLARHPKGTASARKNVGPLEECNKKTKYAI